MSWSPDLFIGEFRPWPDTVQVVRGTYDDTRRYVPEDALVHMELHECPACANVADLQDAMVENVELQDENARLRSCLSDDAENARMIMAENAKLRELVKDMWRFTGAACKKYPRLFDPAAQGGQMVQLNAIDAFEQRMRELGIEVDDA